MTTEQYSIGYDEGYQKGWNDAMESMPAQRKPLSDEQIARVLAQLPVPPTGDGSALHDWAMQAVRVLEKNQ